MSIVPQEYFVKRIGGEHVTVNVMVQPGASPATYEPKPEQLKALSRADAYVGIGVPFESAWIERIAGANRQMLIVDTTQGIARVPMVAGVHEVKGERGGGGRSPDPHIWLSPRLVKIQAKTIRDALAKLDPKHEEEYQANLESFLRDIDELDAAIQEALAGLPSRKFVVFHPAWGYFSRDYDLEMIPIEIGGTEPSARELAELIALARQEAIKVIFAQPEFRIRDAETIAKEIDGAVVLISPLAPDWLDNLNKVARTFADVLGD